MMDDKTQASHWGEADSRHFIDQGRYYVPERELQIDSICALIPPFGISRRGFSISLSGYGTPASRRSMSIG